MNPLYLDGAAGMRVDLDDPALAVTVTNKSRQLFPLSRLSRVIVSGHVDWTMRALFACADAGISVLFLSDNGDVRSRWEGGSRPRLNYLQSVTELLQCVDASVRYQNWLAGMRRMAARSTARRIGMADWRVTDAADLDCWLKNNRVTLNAAALRFLRGFTFSLVTQYLSDAGIDGTLMAGSEEFPLADDLCAILLWDFYPVLCSRNPAFGDAKEQAALAELFEGRRQRSEKLLRGLLNRLHVCLKEPL